MDFTYLTKITILIFYEDGKEYDWKAWYAAFLVLPQIGTHKR